MSALRRSRASRTVPREMENLAIYYTPLGGALTVTPSEKMLERLPSIAGLPKRRPAAEGKPAPPAGETLARLERRLAGEPQDSRSRQRVEPRSVSANDAIAVLGQPADPQRVEAALSRPRSGESAPGGLGRGTRLSGRREVRLERQISDDGLDRLRPSGRTEGRSAGAAGVEQFRRRQLRPDV